MKRLIILATALALAPMAGAQLYKYVDKDGKTVYSDQPPVNADSKRLSAPPPPASAAPQKSAVAQDKEAEKGREAQREKAKKAAEKEKVSQAAEERCTLARSEVRMYTEGGRLARHNEKGERVYLGEAEMQAERARAQRVVDEACKK
jgi:hypothetical protein